jgi:hypothetical protein
MEVLRAVSVADSHTDRCILRVVLYIKVKMFHAVSWNRVLWLGKGLMT